MKVANVLSIGVTLLATVGLAGAVAAADGGNISDTGPGSSNTITQVVNNQSSTSCSNDTTVTGTNLQNAGSGDADSSSNTSGGNSSSGNSSNSNSSTVDVNTGCASLSSSSTTPAKNSSKSASAATTPAATPVAVAGTLPETGSNLTADIAIGSVVVVAATLAASRLGVAAYRRLAL